MTNADVRLQAQIGYRMLAPPGCPETLYNIMKQCWEMEEWKRPIFQTLERKLQFLFNLDYND